MAGRRSMDVTSVHVLLLLCVQQMSSSPLYPNLAPTVQSTRSFPWTENDRDSDEHLPSSFNFPTSQGFRRVFHDSREHPDDIVWSPDRHSLNHIVDPVVEARKVVGDPHRKFLETIQQHVMSQREHFGPPAPRIETTHTVYPPSPFQLPLTPQKPWFYDKIPNLNPLFPTYLSDQSRPSQTNAQTQSSFNSQWRLLNKPEQRPSGFFQSSKKGSSGESSTGKYLSKMVIPPVTPYITNDFGEVTEEATVPPFTTPYITNNFGDVTEEATVPPFTTPYITNDFGEVTEVPQEDIRMEDIEDWVDEHTMVPRSEERAVGGRIEEAATDSVNPPVLKTRLLFVNLPCVQDHFKDTKGECRKELKVNNSQPSGGWRPTRRPRHTTVTTPSLAQRLRTTRT